MRTATVDINLRDLEALVWMLIVRVSLRVGKRRKDKSEPFEVEKPFLVVSRNSIRFL
jgi:hypothetical protein